VLLLFLDFESLLHLF